MPRLSPRAELERLLVDDVPHADLTTEAPGIGSAAGAMEFDARDSMVLAFAEDAAAIIEICGCSAELLASSGTAVRPGIPILKACGSAAGLLQGWKVAQLHGNPRDRRRRHRCIPSDRHCLHAEELTGHEAVRRRNGQGGGGAVMHRVVCRRRCCIPEHRGFLGNEPLAITVERLGRGSPESNCCRGASTSSRRSLHRLTSSRLLNGCEAWDVVPSSRLLAVSIRPMLSRMCGQGPKCWSRPHHILAKPRDVEARLGLKVA